ncbi:MAG: protein-disulfide reductase DsbD N-terminal domain-containing protein [Gemmatales bacterium]|nr:protein-disulfide reductase DsbD N-terminal domain-containing protein [Gemmatales bacterium]MDW8388168.1 protein-disulfide reductase DsbD N-terminal domain-containing protein [Gemmatales bacterium]
MIRTLFALTLVVSLGFASFSQNKQDQSDPVSAQAVLKKRQTGTDGKETWSVEVVLEIEKGWHIYANPAGDEVFVPTVVTVGGIAKDDVEVAYPKGIVHRDETIQVVAYHYEGKTVIPVTVRRPLVNGKPDPQPLEITVRYQACSDLRCLAPKTVKLTVSPAK